MPAAPFLPVAPEIAAPSEAPAPPAAPLELDDVLLSVVAERTGYPVEMLNLDMAVEADLGIDSIKRVEILSEVRDRAGLAAGGGLGELGSLRTLREIDDSFTGRNEAAPPQVPEMARTPLTRLVTRMTDRPPPGLALGGVKASSLSWVRARSRKRLRRSSAAGAGTPLR